MSEGRIGKYEILAKRGDGGFGVVYKAMDTMIERVVAIKVLHQQYAEDEKLATRFRTEAKAMARLNHPNIVTIHGFDIVGDRTFIVMEYVDGQDLDDVLKDKGAMPMASLIQIARQMTSAFGYAHENGIIHRDIKPSNVMVDASLNAKITDFGIAKILGDTKLTKTGSGMGSLHYMSPEQIEGKPIDARTDIYSLGITFYQMITGRVPFNDESEFVIMRAHLDQQPEPPSSLRSDIPPELEGIILRMLEKNPDDRYASMKAISADLDKLVGPQKVDTPAVSSEPTRQETPAPQPQPDGDTTIPYSTGEHDKPKGKGGAVKYIGIVAAVVVAFVLIYTLVIKDNGDEGLMTEGADTIGAVSDEIVTPESTSIDSAAASRHDSVPIASVTPSEPAKEVYKGKLVLQISPFDYVNPPKVMLSGKTYEVDEVPFEISGIKDGWHKLRVSFKDKTFVDRVRFDGEAETRTFKFNGPSGRVSIGAEFIGQDTQPWAEILIDGSPIAQGTPAAIELIEGPHEVMVRKDGYETIGGSKIVWVKSGENAQANFKLKRK